MRAVCWNGKKDVRVETVPDPEIINPRDAIHKNRAHCDLPFRSTPVQRQHPDHESR